MNLLKKELRQVRDFASDLQMSIALMRNLWSPLSKGIIGLLSPLVILILLLISANLRKLFAPTDNSGGLGSANNFDEMIITLGWIGIVVFLAYCVLQAAMISLAIGGVDFWDRNKSIPNLKDLFVYVKKYTGKLLAMSILFGLLGIVSYVVVILPISLATAGVLGALFSLLWFTFFGLSSIYIFTLFGLSCSHLILNRSTFSDAISYAMSMGKIDFFANYGYTLLLLIVVYSPVIVVSFLIGIVVGISIEAYGTEPTYIQFLTIPLYLATTVLSTIFIFVAYAVRSSSLWEKLTSEQLRKEIDGMTFHHDKIDEELEKRLF